MQKRSTTNRIRRVPYPTIVAPANRRTATDAMIESLSILKEENALLAAASEISGRVADAVREMNPTAPGNLQAAIMLMGLVTTARHAALRWRRDGADSASKTIARCSEILTKRLTELAENDTLASGCPDCGGDEALCLWQGQMVKRCDTCHSARAVASKISCAGGGDDA